MSYRGGGLLPLTGVEGTTSYRGGGLLHFIGMEGYFLL